MSIGGAPSSLIAAMPPPACALLPVMTVSSSRVAKYFAPMARPPPKLVAVFPEIVARSATTPFSARIPPPMLAVLPSTVTSSSRSRVSAKMPPPLFAWESETTTSRRVRGLSVAIPPPVPATCPFVTVRPEIVITSPPLSIVNGCTSSFPETASVPAPGPVTVRSSFAVIDKAEVSVIVPVTVLANVIPSSVSLPLAMVIASRNVQLTSHAPSAAPSDVESTCTSAACAAGASSAPAATVAPAIRPARSFSSALRRVTRSRRACARCIERADTVGTPGVGDGGRSTLPAAARGQAPSAAHRPRGAGRVRAMAEDGIEVVWDPAAPTVRVRHARRQHEPCHGRGARARGRAGRSGSTAPSLADGASPDAARELLRATFAALDADFTPPAGGPLGLCVLSGPEELRADPAARWADPPLVHAGFLPDGRQARIGYFTGAHIDG